MKRALLVVAALATLRSACERPQPSGIRPSDTHMSGESFPLTQVIWSLTYSSDFVPEPVTRQRTGLSDSDADTFLAFSAEAKARIRAHQRESAAALSVPSATPSKLDSNCLALF